MGFATWKDFFREMFQFTIAIAVIVVIALGGLYGLFQLMDATMPAKNGVNNAPRPTACDRACPCGNGKLRDR